MKRPAGIGILQLEIAGEIDQAMAEYVERAIASYPTRSVEVEIDCIGGDWAATLRIFTALVDHDRLVTAHISKAESGGALVALAADVREMRPDGHFFVHWPRPTAGHVAQSALDAVARSKANLMAGRCRVPAGRFLDWMKNASYIDAKRAVAIGLVHDVDGLRRPTHPVVFL